MTPIRAAGLHEVKVIVGGAPVTAEYAREIGADGYGPDAATAADVLLRDCSAADAGRAQRISMHFTSLAIS